MDIPAGYYLDERSGLLKQVIDRYLDKPLDILPITTPPDILPRHKTHTRAIRRYHFLDEQGNVLYGAAEYACEDALWYFFLTKSGYKWFRTDLGVKADKRILVAGPPE